MSAAQGLPGALLLALGRLGAGLTVADVLTNGAKWEALGRLSSLPAELRAKYQSKAEEALVLAEWLDEEVTLATLRRRGTVH